MLERWDPLQPEAPHVPADGSDGVVVGDDTDRLPRYLPVRRPHGWWLLVVVLAAVGAAVAVVLLAAPHVGGDAPDRVPAPCRCGTRPA